MGIRACIRARGGCQVRAVVAALPVPAQGVQAQASDGVGRYSLWRGAKPLGVGMPFTFSTGSVVRGFVARCVECGEHIKPDDLRGRIREIRPDLLLMSAFGMCGSCSCVTEYWQRVAATRAGLLVERSVRMNLAGAELDLVGVVEGAPIPIRRVVCGVLDFFVGV